MKLTFYGAAGEVTGSCYLLETSRARIVIDFGIHQGMPDAEERNRRPPPLNAPTLDAVVLTHGHLDHSGLLPLLKEAKYAGRIYATPATMDLTPILLRDSARIQENDAERDNEDRAREGLGALDPLFSLDDVSWTMSRFKSLPYYEWREIAPGVRLRLSDAGHIIGSASAELIVQEEGKTTRVVFSGDIGPTGVPLVRDPTALHEAEVLILESTYGDRDHKPRDETIAEFAEIVENAARGTGKVLIPAFAVGRTQDLIYELGKLQRAGRLKTEVFIDSPMAIETTELYRSHKELFDGDALSMINRGEMPLRFDGLQYVRSGHESRKLNARSGIIVIAGAGMCTGGRILFHLKHNLGNPETHLVFVGYQARGTLGRRIVDGDKHVRIMDANIHIRAAVHTIGGFSAHAGQSGLVGWAGNFKPAPKRIFLTHGEDRARFPLRDRIKRELGIACELPYTGESVQL